VEPPSSKSSAIGEVSLSGDSDPIPSERLSSEDATDASFAARHTALTASASAAEASVNMSIDFLSVLKFMENYLAFRKHNAVQTLIKMSKTPETRSCLMTVICILLEGRRVRIVIMVSILIF
jgi:hypothetical protein